MGPRNQSSPFADPAVAATELPLAFQANAGQADSVVKFLARGPGYSVFLTPREFVLGLTPKVTGHQDTVVRMRLVNADPEPAMRGLRQLPGKTNYFSGTDPNKWLTDIPSYEAVEYKNAYPGIDLVFHRGSSGLEYDFIVAPGADPDAVSLSFSGADAVSIDARGDLVLQTASRQLRQTKPVVYQDVDGQRRPVDGSFVIGHDGHVGFALGRYDRTQPLVIDPVLPYSTYLGGNVGDGGTAVTVDQSGNAYVTGWTRSLDFPAEGAAPRPYAGEDGPTGAYCTSFQAGVGCGDAFVLKLDPERSRVIYATYFGGGSSDGGYGIAVDGTGNAYVTGETKSVDLPVQNGFHNQLRFRSATLGSDAFVAKLDPSGTLSYSTYLGLLLSGRGTSIAVDASGKVYVAGFAGSGMRTQNALQPAFGGGVQDAFVAKIDPAASGASSLLYSTYLGGAGNETANGIATDPSGHAYVTGVSGPGFPVKNGVQVTPAGIEDAFVAKIAPDGSAMIYATYLGGAGNDTGKGIAVDSSGSAYVTGTTESGNFPTRNAFKAEKQAGPDAFVAKLHPDGSDLVYSSYMGGGGADGRAIAIDPAGRAYVAGVTRSDFPTKDPLQAIRRGTTDAFVAAFDPSQSGETSLLYATYLGGDGEDEANGIAVDGAGSAYVTGYTDSPVDFPTVRPLQRASAGGTDAFLAKVSQVAAGAPKVREMSPTSGPASGGTPVVITGEGFRGATAVTFGGVKAESHSVNSSGTRITVRAPRHQEGTVSVTVSTGKGTSSPSVGTGFTYSVGGWTSVAGTGRFNHTATMLPNGTVLVAGGCITGDMDGGCLAATDSAEIYDPETGTWNATGKMAVPRPAKEVRNTINQTATLLPSGKVLVIGGNIAQIYDPTTGTWAATASPTRFFLHTATLLANGKVLRLDGRTGVAELYDPEAGTWAQAKGKESTANPYQTATVLPDGRVFFMGGDSADLYDPASDTWVEAPNSEVPRAYHTATLLPDGRVLVAGGRDDSTEPTGATEIFDPNAVPDPQKPEAKGAWTPTRPLAVPRYAHIATLLPSGKVLVMGGSYEYGTRLAAAELYDPAVGQWKPAGEMSAGRGGSVPRGGGQGSGEERPRGGASFTATLLRSGAVLVVGGSDATVTDGHTSAEASADMFTSAIRPQSSAEESSSSNLWVVGVVALLVAVLLVVGWRVRAGRRAGPVDAAR